MPPITAIMAIIWVWLSELSLDSDCAGTAVCTGSMRLPAGLGVTVAVPARWVGVGVSDASGVADKNPVTLGVMVAVFVAVGVFVSVGGKGV